jgi:hypothetical protein
MTKPRIITPFDPEYVAQVKIKQPGRLPANPTKGWLGESTARLTREERILQHRHGGAYMRAKPSDKT